MHDGLMEIAVSCWLPIALTIIAAAATAISVAL